MLADERWDDAGGSSTFHLDQLQEGAQQQQPQPPQPAQHIVNNHSPALPSVAAAAAQTDNTSPRNSAVDLQQPPKRPRLAAAADSGAVEAVSVSSSVSVSPPSTGASSTQRKRQRKAWREESLSRRASHANTDARRRSAIAQLQSSLVRIVRQRTGGAALTTEKALEQAVALLQQHHDGHSPHSSSSSSSSPSTSISSSAPPRASVHHDDDQWQDWEEEEGAEPCQSEGAQLLSMTGILPAVPRPFSFSNSHLRKLSSFMDLAVSHYATGAAFHPSLPNFRSSPALHSLLAGGGMASVMTSGMRMVDSTHDVSLMRMADRIGKRPGGHCSLRLSDSETEPSISYDDLARMLVPVVQAMNADGSVSQSSPVELSQCVLVGSVYPRWGRKVRSLKMMSLVRHADGRPAVMFGVQFIGTIYPV